MIIQSAIIKKKLSLIIILFLVFTSKVLSIESKIVVNVDNKIITNLDINNVRELADGSSMLGKMAHENGLIDKFGDLALVEKYLAETIGEEVEVCWN